MSKRGGASRGETTEAERSLGVVLDFMRLLWAVDHGLSTVSKRMLSKLGVTGPQRLVVRLVGRYPGISAGEIASLLHLHPSTLTGVLRRLAAQGLVVRSSDASDTRRALFRLSARGKTLDAVRTGTVESAVRAALGALPVGDVDRTRRVLAALADRLEQASTEPD
jgi:DNA-binding MarR family transcriptional regulator